MKSRVLWLTIGGASLATVVASALVWMFLVAPMRSAIDRANRIQQEFSHLLNLSPRISVNHAILFAQNSPVLDLVTMERQALARHRLEETWLHSTKTFEIEASFHARAGFHLREAFTVNVRPGGKVAEVHIPPAKILSVDMSDLRILLDEDGLWNGLSAHDREKAIRELEKTAKADFLRTDILSAALREAKNQIREIAKSSGCEVIFPGADSEEKR
jgi:hypothetical protein